MPGAVVGAGDGMLIRIADVPALSWDEVGSKYADKERVREYQRVLSATLRPGSCALWSDWSTCLKTSANVI